MIDAKTFSLYSLLFSFLFEMSKLTNIQVLKEMDELYYNSDRGSILREFYRTGRIVGNLWFYLFFSLWLISMPLFIGVAVQFRVWVLLLMVSSMILMLLLFIHVPVKPFYEKYELTGLSYWSKKNLLHYCMFKAQCDQLMQKHHINLTGFVDWLKCYQKKFNVLKLLNSSLWFHLVILGLLGAFVKAQNIDWFVESRYSILVLALIVSLYIFSYLIFDSFHLKSRRQFELTRFIEMYISDKNDSG